MNPKRYTIPTYGRKEELIRVLSILFSHGYVYGRTCHGESCRERDILNFINSNEEAHIALGYSPDVTFDNLWSNWRYIATGTDVKCKMVLVGYSQLPYNSTLINLEDFLKITK